MKKLLYYCTIYTQYVTGIMKMYSATLCIGCNSFTETGIQLFRIIGEGAQKSGKVFHVFTAVVENEANYK